MLVRQLKIGNEKAAVVLGTLHVCRWKLKMEAIYSYSDGLVDYQACIGVSGQCNNISSQWIASSSL